MVALEGIEPVVFAAALALAAGLAVLARALSETKADAPSVVRGLALATDTISAPFFLCAAGAVFAWGPDGLAFVVGLGAGYLLLQLLVAPLLPAAGAGSVPEFIALRYGGGAPRALAVAAVAASMAVLLVAQLMAAGLVTARLLGLEADVAVAVAAVALLVCFAVRGAAGAPWVSGLLFPVMLLALLAPIALLSWQWFGQPVPQIAYANALVQIRGLEEMLLENELADPAVMTPMLRPFLTLDPLNFLGLVLGLAVGMASLPNVLSRHAMTAGARKVRWAAVWALVFAALLLSAVPAIAAYAKLALLTLIADRTELTDLPAWVFTYGRLGLVEICGHAATGAAAVAKACAAAPDASSVLHLQDVTLDPDMIVLAAPEIAGLGPTSFGLLAAAGLAAALVAADGPLAAVVAMLGWKRNAASAPGPAAKDVPPFAPYVMAAVVVAIAGLAATTRPAGILTVATWALTLAAAGLFPVIVAGLWWRRPGAAAAVAAMTVGLGACLFYLVGTRYFAVTFFETWPSLSNAGPTAREIFVELKHVWMAAAPGAAKDAAYAALDAHAQTMANWWGIGSLAAALIALPAGAATLVVVALIAPARRRADDHPQV